MDDRTLAKWKDDKRIRRYIRHLQSCPGHSTLAQGSKDALFSLCRAVFDRLTRIQKYSMDERPGMLYRLTAKYKLNIKTRDFVNYDLVLYGYALTLSFKRTTTQFQ